MKRTLVTPDISNQIQELIDSLLVKIYECPPIKDKELQEQYWQKLQQNKTELLNALNWSDLTSDERNQLVNLRLPKNASAACHTIYKLIQRGDTISSLLRRELKSPETFSFFQFLPDELKQQVAYHVDYRTVGALSSAHSTYGVLFKPYSEVAELLRDIYALNYKAVDEKITAKPKLMFEYAVYKNLNGFYEEISPLKLSVKILNCDIYFNIFYKLANQYCWQQQFMDQLTGQTVFDVRAFINHRKRFAKPNIGEKYIGNYGAYYDDYQCQFSFYNEKCENEFGLNPLQSSNALLIDILCERYEATKANQEEHKNIKDELLNCIGLCLIRVSLIECDQLLSRAPLPNQCSTSFKQLYSMLKRHYELANLVRDEIQEYIGKNRDWRYYY